MNKIDVMNDIDELTDTYCVDCLGIRDLRKKVHTDFALKVAQLVNNYNF